MVFLLIKFFVETTYQWNTVTQPFIATNPFSSFVVPAPGMGVGLNWRGKSLISHEIIVNLIAGTTTRTGLKIEAELDTNVYPAGIEVTDKELKNIRIEKAAFHGEWSYMIIPKNETRLI